MNCWKESQEDGDDDLVYTVAQAMKTLKVMEERHCRDWPAKIRAYYFGCDCEVTYPGTLREFQTESARMKERHRSS